MALPKYHELYVPFLETIKDGNIHTMKEIKAVIAQMLQLTEEELAERLSSRNQAVFDNRLGWASAYLKKAGLINAPQRARFQITDEGKYLLDSGAVITDNMLAKRYPEFAEFKYGAKRLVEAAKTADVQEPAETPLLKR